MGRVKSLQLCKVCWKTYPKIIFLYIKEGFCSDHCKIEYSNRNKGVSK